MENKEHQISTHKTKIEQGIVQSYLDNLYNNAVSNLMFIAGGEGSQAFSFEVNREKFIIRVNKHSDNGFKKDQYAFLHFASYGIPIPEVLKIDKLEDGHYFAISKKVEGDLFKNLPDEEFDETLPQLFKNIEVIHEILVSDKAGYGKWNSSGVAEKTSWKEVLLDVDVFAKEMFGNTSLEKDIWDKVYARFVELLPYCPEDKYLVHADCNFDNILSKDGKITGIIDWESSLYGDFLYDIAWLSFWTKDFDYEKAYLDFCKTTGKEIEHFKERVLCYKLFIGLGSLSFYVYSKQDDKYERSKRKLLEFIGA
jgi:hygromycin-B 4-O-kinase